MMSVDVLRLQRELNAVRTEYHGRNGHGINSTYEYVCGLHRHMSIVESTQRRNIMKLNTVVGIVNLRFGLLITWEGRPRNNIVFVWYHIFPHSVRVWFFGQYEENLHTSQYISALNGSYFTGKSMNFESIFFITYNLNKVLPHDVYFSFNILEVIKYGFISQAHWTKMINRPSQTFLHYELPSKSCSTRWLSNQEHIYLLDVLIYPTGLCLMWF